MWSFSIGEVSVRAEFMHGEAEEVKRRTLQELLSQVIKLTSMRRMSMDRTVVKKNICRKKSDTRPTTAKRQNS